MPITVANIAMNPKKIEANFEKMDDEKLMKTVVKELSQNKIIDAIFSDEFSQDSLGIKSTSFDYR